MKIPECISDLAYSSDMRNGNERFEQMARA